MLLSACKGDALPDTASDAGDGLVLGAEVGCEAPVDGFERLEEQAEARGIDLVAAPVATERPCNLVPGGVIAADVDADGDEDLLFQRLDGLPHAYENERGQFTAVSLSGSIGPVDEVYSQGAVDLDGDGLPELLLVGVGVAVVLPNLGGWSFGEPQVVLEETSYPKTCLATIVTGDLDGDGDLDLVLPGLDAVPQEDWVVPLEPGDGSLDRVYENVDGHFELQQELVSASGVGMSLLAAATDRDLDGDQDLLVASDRANIGTAPTSFYRNDGPFELVDDAPELAADLAISGMGLAVDDYDGDGLPDYCMSDISSHLPCLLSDGAGAYVEGGLQLGLTQDLAGHPDLPSDWSEQQLADAEAFWSTWSLERVDLDNDGIGDLVASAGQPPDLGDVGLSNLSDFQPDALWRGLEGGGFEDRTHAQGFGDPEAHYGMAAADFDGDGYRDLVIGVHEGRPRFWSNPCGEAAWLEVELVGPEGNRDGIGALVAATIGERTSLRQIHDLRTVGQGPPEAAFGLGEAEQVDRLVVHWPDGSRSTYDDVPGRRVVQVHHPSRLDQHLDID